jgi:uncharacterized membrane protein
MNKKVFLVALALLLVLAATRGASASSFKWVGETSGSVESCACEAQRLVAEVSNDGSAAQNFAFNADFGENANKFSFFVTPSVQVPANSKSRATLIAAPACDAPLGDYPFVLTASGSGGQEFSLDGSVRVVECRSLKVNAPSEVPTCSGETASLAIRIVNDGETRAKGSIITDLSPGVFTLSDSSFDLKAGGEKTVTLSVSVPSRTPPGAIPFKINAVAQGVYVEALSQITVLDCSGLRVLMPGVISAEPATSAKQNVVLRNDAAGADSFTLSLANCPSWVTLETKTLSLDASASGTTNLVITPPNDAAGKEFNCTLRAVSAKRGNSFEGTSKIRVTLPSAASLSLPLPGEYCEANASANLTLTVKNTGDYQGTFELSSSGAPGALDAGLASIAPGETKRFVFALDLRRPGDYALAVTVKGAFGAATKTTTLHVVKCNDFEIALAPASASLCPNETANFTLRIKNAGRRSDSYSVTAQAPGFAASASAYAAAIAPGASSELAIMVTAPQGSQAAAARSLTVAVKSNAAQATRTAGASLEVRGTESCAARISAAGPTGAFTSLYAGIAGFLVALVAGLFIVFALAGRKKPLEESEEKESAGEESAEEAEEAEETKGKPKPPKTKRGKPKKKR